MNNKGDTLIEIIVTVVILGIVLVTGLNAFSTSRQTNNISNKYIQAEALATGLLEESAYINFDDIIKSVNNKENLEVTPSSIDINTPYIELNPNMSGCILKIPSNMKTDSSWNVSIDNVEKQVVSGSSIGNSIKMTLDNIVSNKVSYNVELIFNNINYQEKFNNEKFVILDTITDDSTCIIDSTGAANNSFELDENGEFKYNHTTHSLKYFIKNYNQLSNDSLALDYFESSNKIYIDRKVAEENARRAEYNENNKNIEGFKPLEYVSAKQANSKPGEPMEEYQYFNKEDLKSYIEKTLEITILQYKINDELIEEVNAVAKYELKQRQLDGSWIPIIEDESTSEQHNNLREVSYIITRGEKLSSLKNLYLMHVPLITQSCNINESRLGRWKSDQIILNNGTDIENAIELNFYLVEQPYYSDTIDTKNEYGLITNRTLIDVPSRLIDGKPNYDAPIMKINTYNPSKGITVYTNTNLTLSESGLADSVKNLYSEKLHLQQEEYTRMFDVEIIVKDSNKNVLYTKKDTNILR